MTLGIGNLVGQPLKPGSMGKPIPGYGIDLVDPDGTPTADGDTGEIVIKTTTRPSRTYRSSACRTRNTARRPWPASSSRSPAA